jgi:hypothetical protein
VSLLAERLLALDDAFSRAGLPYAFGGAIARAYCTLEPRGTRDLDVNVFVTQDRAGDVLGVMPHGVTVTEADVEAAGRVGQVRVWWEDTPIDLFLDSVDFHREAARGVRKVEFQGQRIPVLGCDALVVFKAMLDRTRHWGDIEAVVEAQPAAAAKALPSLTRMVGSDDPRVRRLRSVLR